MSIYNPSVFMFEERLSQSDINSLIHALYAGHEELIPGVDFDTDKSILKVCEYFGKDTEINNEWADLLNRYVYNFTTRKVADVDYAEFFGSPYVGLQKIRFTDADLNAWFTDIYDVDMVELKENLHRCKWVNPKFNVTSDIFNLTIPYLLYRVYHSKLSQPIKHQSMVNILVMYHCKCLTGILVNDYPFPARPEVAYETYNRLSLKYDIKKYGNWRALIKARAEFIIDPKTGIHFKTFTNMNDDKAIIYMVGDIQDRLRGVINDINKVFHDVKNRINIVSINNVMVTLNEELSLKDTTKEISKYKTYINSVLTTGGFNKSELVGYAAEALDHSPKDKLDLLVTDFGELYNNPKPPKFIDKTLPKTDPNYQIDNPCVRFVDEVITHLFEYMHLHRISPRNLKEVLTKMRGGYQSTRSTSESLILMRKLGEFITKDLTGIKTPIVLTSLRTSLMLYIVLRTLTMDNYK